MGDALGRLRELLWYLHEASGLYYFSSQPNLNRIVVERENAVDPEQIRQALRERLERIAGRELRVYLEPHSPQDVPDTKELKLAVLSEPSGVSPRSFWRRRAPPSVPTRTPSSSSRPTPTA